MIKRDRYLKKLMNRRGNGLVKIVTGVRRCGKSYLLNQLFADALEQEGFPRDHIIMLSFDSRRYAALREPDALIAEIDKVTAKGGKYFLLLDEVQMVGDFVEVLNDFLRNPDFDIFVTGSNAKFLSSDIVTEFRGRGDQIRMAPLSFSEYFAAVGGDRLDAWRDFCMYGGLPLVATCPTEDAKIDYLSNIFDEIYTRDLSARYHIRHLEEFDELTDVISSAIGSLTNPAKLANVFKTVKRKTISEATIRKYISYLEDSFLIESAKRFDIKGKFYIGTPLKYYFCDPGLRNVRLNFRQVEESHLMENILFNELRGRGYTVDVGVVPSYGTDGGKQIVRRHEIDFVCNRGSSRFYIQSALSLPDEEKLAQERRSLLRTGDSFKKVIVTKDHIKAHYDPDGILIVNIFDFLADETFLESI